MRKPSYSLSRRAFWLSFVLAWAVVLVLVGGALNGVREAVDLASIALPSMVVLIASLLGIHRFSGAMDMRTMAERQPFEQRDPGQRPDDLEGP